MNAREPMWHGDQTRPNKDSAETGAHHRSTRGGDPRCWVEVQVQQAMRSGEFDNLPGAGKPIPGIDAPHDPDWWLKRLIERERISILPPAIALRKEHAEMVTTLDREATAAAVRRVIEDFNARIVEARRQLQGGPPVVTPLHDVDAEIEAWTGRRAERIAQQKTRLAEVRAMEFASTPPSWRRRLIARLLPS